MPLVSQQAMLREYCQGCHNDNLKREGQRDQAVGEVKEAAESAAEKVKDTVERVAEKVKDKVKQAVEKVQNG